MQTKFLMIGCGDIAQRVAAHLGAENFHYVGLRRDPGRIPAGIEPLPLDLNRDDGWEALHGVNGNLVLLTLTPNRRDEAGYRQAYVANLEKVLNAFKHSTQLPRRLIFVSSTSVYGQDAGEWVDETSHTEPKYFNGRVLLEAERLLAHSGFEHTVIRCAGIYGPGRTRLLEQVLKGQWDPHDRFYYSNRIHVEDCAAFIAQLARQYQRGEQWQPLYIAADSEPVPLDTVKRWLATELKVPVPEMKTTLGDQPFSNKRCSNLRMRDNGYRFIYPTFREGYRDLIALETRC